MTINNGRSLNKLKFLNDTRIRNNPKDAVWYKLFIETIGIKYIDAKIIEKRYQLIVKFLYEKIKAK